MEKINRIVNKKTKDFRNMKSDGKHYCPKCSNETSQKCSNYWGVGPSTPVEHFKDKDGMIYCSICKMANYLGSMERMR